MNVLPYRDILPTIAESAFIAPGAWVIGDVVIGERSGIWFNSVVRGDEHYIRIGSESNIQDNSTLHVTEGKFPLEIGDRVTVGHRVILHGCIIENECLIGMGAIILDGARIGTGSLVAAGSVITPGFVVPPRSVVMGVPAKVTKTVTDAEHQRIMRSVLHYTQLAAEHMNPSILADERRVKGFLG